MLQVLLEFIRKNTRDLPCGLKWRKLVKLFKKKDSSFYWYDFNVRGTRYRGSTKETNRKRAEKVAALELSQTIERRDPLDKKSPSLVEFSTVFRLDRLSGAGDEVKEVLPQWLAPAFEDENRWDANRSHC